MSDSEEEHAYLDRAALRREQEAGVAKGQPDDFQAHFSKLLVQGSQDDEDKTHLIHGLDRTLLEEQRRKYAQALRPEDIIPVEEPIHVDPTALAWAKSIIAILSGRIHKHSTKFKVALQRLRDFIEAGGRFRGSSRLFLPGRMVIMFDSSARLSHNDIPRTVHRPKEDTEIEEQSIHFRRSVWPSARTLSIVRGALSGRKTVSVGGTSLSSLLSSTAPLTTAPDLKSVPTEKERSAKADDDIFADEGGLNIEEELMKAAAKSKGTSSGTRERSKLLAEMEKLRMEAGLLKLSSAEVTRRAAEQLEEEQKEQDKRKLERVPDEPIAPELNPFSLQNASLVPLMTQPASSHKAKIIRATTRELQEASERADAEYGITSYDFDEWADENDLLTAEDKARYNLGRKFAAKLGKSENDPDILRKVEGAMRRNRERRNNEGKQLKEIGQILEGKRARGEDSGLSQAKRPRLDS